MNAIASVTSRSQRFLWYRSIFTSICNLTESHRTDLIAELKRKIEENNKILRKHSYGGFRARGIDSSNNNLRIAMQNAEKKIMEANANTIANIPSQVSIEILANGTGHVQPCVFIRTPLKTYMFNCPEGASRFLPQVRLRSMNITDIFITRSIWDNIAGISSVLLSKESNALATRLHGAVNIKNFLECIRPFQDSDYGSEKYPSQVEEYPFSEGIYEDAGLKVVYIPLSIPLNESTSSQGVDIAYYVEMKDPARRIDPRKVINMGVPKGPLIGRLKNGEAITLKDGKVIRPEDVFAADDVSAKDRKRALIVDCKTENHLKAFIENSLISELVNTKNVDFIIHFTPQKVLQLPNYLKFFESFGNHCKNVVVNGNGPVVPGTESIYRNHHLLNTVCESVFPKLHPYDWKGEIYQDSQYEENNGIFCYAAPLQRFWMRPAGESEPIRLDLRMNNNEINDNVKELISSLNQNAKIIGSACEYPKVTFLGTSSAVPSKYRNVTGYLLETASTSAIMIDVGEGSYGQMKVILGKEGLEEMLLKLRAVLITHAHQDHMNGLNTIIQKRKEVFDKQGKEYIPLVLVCNRNVLKPLKTFSLSFEDVQSLVEVVDISRFPITPPLSPQAKKRRIPSPHLSATRDVLELMPSIFQEKEWNIQEIKAVQVHHTRMANGFIIRANGKKCVFSGDTKPCDLLVEEGKDADVLIHEATFEDGHEVDAAKKKHSTMGQAVDVGRRMGAKNIILTHFSARYPKVPALPKYLDEYGNISVAMDNMSVPFDKLALLPKLIPIYREIYHEELFDIELRRGQRDLKLKVNQEDKEVEQPVKSNFVAV